MKIRYCEHVSQNVKAMISHFYLRNKYFHCQHKTFFLLPNGRVDNITVWYADRNLVKVFLEFKVRLTWLYPLICDIDVWASTEKAYSFRLTVVSVCGMVIVLTPDLSRFFSIYIHIVMLYTMLQFFFWQKKWQTFYLLHSMFWTSVQFGWVALSCLVSLRLLVYLTFFIPL